mgnify:CR=1 FL=1
MLLKKKNISKFNKDLFHIYTKFNLKFLVQINFYFKHILAQYEITKPDDGQV